MTYSIGFLMQQNAGYLTNYLNFRSVVEETAPGDVIPAWHELCYYRPGGKLERLRESYLTFLPGYLTGNSRMVLEFRQALMNQPYDAILTNSWAAMFFASRLSRIPTIIDFDSTPRQLDRMAIYGSPDDPAPLATLKHRLSMRGYRSAQLLQAWSNWAKDSVVKEYGISAEKVMVNPPGVDLDFFRPPRSGREMGDRKLRVVFVGGDFKRKGGHLLIEWFRQQTTGDVELHLATREAVVRLPGIHVHDVRPNSNELLQIYQQGDVFVLPSLGECFGVATVEAMATGLPVVVSDVGGTADIVEHGENGFITKAGDRRQLSDTLGALLSDPDKRQSMGKRSRQLAEQRFDARRNALRTLEILRHMALGGRRQTASKSGAPDERDHCPDG
jgi:glycosyltransferase involved in cell wall biosynthesis